MPPRPRAVDVTVDLGRLSTTVGAFYSPLPARTLLIDGTFEGGGSLGAAYCGSLLALARNGTWFKRVAGNSAGAIHSSVIAAGYDANEIDFLWAPKGARSDKPAGLPAGLGENEVHYADFMDPPMTAAQISIQSKRNSMIYHLLKGTLIDTIRQTRVNLPDIAAAADQISTAVVNALPGKIGPFTWRLEGVTFKTGWNAPFDKFTVGGQDITVGPFDLSLNQTQKDALKKAIKDSLGQLPKSAALSDLKLGDTEAMRMTIADTAIDAALNLNPVLREYFNIMGDGGLFDGDAFLNKMRKLLEAKVGRKPVRFRDLPIPLTVIASDWTNHTMLVYSSDDAATKDMEVAEAVRRSMSVPFVWEPRHDVDAQGRPIEIVDGGLMENWPIWAHLTAQNPDDLARPKIGFFLDSSKKAPAGDPCGASEYDAGATLLTTLTEGPQSTRGTENQGLIEQRFFERLMNWGATNTKKSPLHDALATYYQRKPNVKLYECEIPLEGFFWLDPIMSKQTYAAMACRGWEAVTRTIREGSVGATPTATNPYKK